MPLLRTIAKMYFRSEVTGMEKVPRRGVLLVSNHSGGTLAYDVPLLAVAFSEEFGDDRPLCTLAHDLIFIGQGDAIFRKFGFLPRTRATRSPHSRTAWPPSSSPAVTGTPCARPETGPGRLQRQPGLHPHSSQGRGADRPHRHHWRPGDPTLPQRRRRPGQFLRLDKLIRAQRAPLVLGFPFGLRTRHDAEPSAAFKMVTRVLDPIDITAEFGADPDIDAVDELIRSRMQAALDELSDERRFPIIG